MKRKFLSLIVAMVMVFGIITPPRGNVAYAAGETAQLAIGDYVKTSGTLDSSKGNYQGTWTAHIPLATVMGPIMPIIPDSGYPHGKDGKNTIAYIEYRVQFPKNVTIGEGITTANTSNIIDGNGIKATTSGNVVTFKIPLQDVDNPSLKKNYERDVQNDPSTKTVDLSIPYSFKTKDVPDAGNKSITSDGEIEIHPSGSFWSFNKIIFASDQATKPLASDLSATPDPADPGQGSPMEISLEGDILIGDETEHDKVFTTQKDAPLNFTGALDVTPIKKQLAEIEKQHQNASAQGENIVVSNLDFSMIATFELPKEMDFDPATVEAMLSGDNGKFEIASTKTEGRKVTVTLKLKNQENYKNFEDIKTAVNGTDDVLKVTLSGAKFNAASKPNTNYTVKGTVGGGFKATATFNKKSIDFSFIFKGLQSKEGKDFVIANDANNTAIQFTLKYKEEKTPSTPSTPSTPGWTVTPINPADSKLNLVDHLAYMKGYPDLTFGPDRNMTRAEVTMMFARLLKDRPEANKVYAMPYSDVTKADWYAYAVSYMTENKLIMGYPDGTFKPNNPISRAEFAAIASRFDQLKPGLSLPFNDVAKGHWAYDVIASAADKGWVSGYPDGSFKPENKITRAEVVSTTNRMLNRYADLAFAKAHKNELAPMRDMDESHWAYGAAVEAMNGHDYRRQADGKNETWILLNGKRFTFPIAPSGIAK